MTAAAELLAGSRLPRSEARLLLAAALGTSVEALTARPGQAVEAATEVPARVLKLPTVGRLGAGMPADVVVLTDEIEIERVLVGGTDRVAL